MLRFPRQTTIFASMFALLLITSTAWADVDSGPTVGEAVPALKIKAVVGDNAGQEVDWVADRGEKPTVYFFVRADKLTRPSARVLRKVDEAAGKNPGAKIVFVMLSDDSDKTAARLEAIQQSLKFENTTLCLFAKNYESPELWGVNSDADLTAVLTAGGKVKQRFGWVGPNETSAEPLIKALTEAVNAGK